MYIYLISVKQYEVWVPIQAFKSEEAAKAAVEKMPNKNNVAITRIDYDVTEFIEE